MMDLQRWNCPKHDEHDRSCIDCLEVSLEMQGSTITEARELNRKLVEALEYALGCCVVGGDCEDSVREALALARGEGSK